MPTPFDKDFAYLIPFLDRVAAAAGTVRDPAGRAELQRLLQGEKQKWERIRGILGGAPGADVKGGDVTPTTAAEPSRSGPSFSVGSLKRGR